MSRRTSILSIIIGLALLIGAPATWYLSQPADTIGEVAGVPEADDQTDLATGTASEPADEPDPQTNLESADEPAAADEADGLAAAPESPEPVVEPLNLSTTPLSGTVVPIAKPQRISIPSLGVDAPIDGVGVEPNGEMEIPHDIRRIGWFEPGAVRPGRSGTAVLSGHVDSRTQGQGAFYRLREMDLDQTITITHEDGEQSEWKVVGRTSYGKDDIPIGEIFTRSGEPRLALITCGGDFDSANRRYQENVVVYAAPVDA